MSKEKWDFIDTAKRMVVEYYNRYISQKMNRYPRWFRKKITEDDVNIINHSLADNIEEITLNAADDKDIIYTVSRDIETNEIKSYLIKKTFKEGE